MANEVSTGDIYVTVNVMEAPQPAILDSVQDIRTFEYPVERPEEPQRFDYRASLGNDPVGISIRAIFEAEGNPRLTHEEFNRLVRRTEIGLAAVGAL